MNTKTMTLKEILTATKKAGILLPLTTFKFYQKIGLLPGPVAKVRKKGTRGGVYGQYSSSVPWMIERIHEHQKKGRTLDKIISLSEAMVIHRFKEELKKEGFTGYTLPELSGFTPEEMAGGEKLEHEICEAAAVGYYRDKIDSEDGEAMIFVLADSINGTNIFERKLLSKLHWYDSPKSFEAHALLHISKTLDDRLGGLSMATMVLLKSDDMKAFYRVSTKLHEVKILFYKVNARLAELSGKGILTTEINGVSEKNGVYSGMTKAQWNEAEEHSEKMLLAYQKLLSERENEFEQKGHMRADKASQKKAKS